MKKRLVIFAVFALGLFLIPNSVDAACWAEQDNGEWIEGQNGNQYLYCGLNGSEWCLKKAPCPSGGTE